jgi:hypothetical protein
MAFEIPEFVQKVALKKLTKDFIETGTKAVVITMDDKGKFVFTPFHEPVKILPESDYQQLLKMALNES